jgi:cytochrome c oxidase assembly protein subunit 15
VVNIAIVLTGAAVRVTGSGLGCPTWPTCDGAHLIGPLRYHAAIEWGNRLFTDLIVIATIANVVAAARLRPRRPDLVRLAVVVFGGVIAQAVVGGITVLTKLTPPFVMAHFVLSMAIIWIALVAWRKAKAAAPPVDPVAPPAVTLTRAAAALAGLVVILGTATTAAGPHSGDDVAKRLGQLSVAVHIHGTGVALLLGVALATRLMLQYTGAPARVRTMSTVQMYLIAAQGGIGILQYVLRLPTGLVEAHVAGAVAVWVCSLWLALSVRAEAVAVAVERPHALEAAG